MLACYFYKDILLRWLPDFYRYADAYVVDMSERMSYTYKDKPIFKARVGCESMILHDVCHFLTVPLEDCLKVNFGLDETDSYTAEWQAFYLMSMLTSPERAMKPFVSKEAIAEIDYIAANVSVIFKERCVLLNDKF